MSKIIIYQNDCKIIDEEDDVFLKQLDRHLSFKILGSEYSKAYKGYVNERGEHVSWDGRKHLMTSYCKFPSGLLPRVKQFYKDNNKLIELIDKRSIPDPGNPIDILPALKYKGITPYPFQIEAVKRAKSVDRGIIRLATGSGKTIVAALLAAELGKKTIIFVIGIDLLYQIHSLFSELLDQPIGIVGDGKCEIRDINIATVWTVGQVLGLNKTKISLDDESSKEKLVDSSKFRSIKEMLLEAKVILFDECHLAACDTIQIIARSVKPEHVYGMSASPWRDDNADLLIEALLGEKIIDLGAKWMVSNGYLVKPDIRFLAPPKMKRIGKQYQKVYSKYITSNEIRNGMVLKGAVKLTESGFKTLVLFRSLKHGKILYDLISKQIPCELLSGKDSSKKRNKVKDMVENDKLNCIIASNIYDQGVDLPALSGLIVASGGKSSVRALQRIGRVIRKYPKKNKAAVIDFADQAPYLTDHSIKRKEIYKTEFEVKWPEKIHT